MLFTDLVSPPENDSFRKDLCFTHDVFFCQREISENGQLRSSAANISEMDEDIQNWIVIPCMAIPPALGETSTVKFGPVTLEI